MAPIEHYRNLKQQKQALLVESQLNRTLLMLEVENLRSSTARLDSTLTTARRIGPWMLPLVSTMGFFAARRARNKPTRLGWFGLILRYLPILFQLGKSKPAVE